MNTSYIDDKRIDTNIKKDKGAFYKIIIFLVHPFIGFLTSLIDLKSRSSYLIIFLFCLLFGWTFMPVNEAADSFRYAQDYYEFSISPHANLIEVFHSYFSVDSEIKDLYIYICYYLSSIIGGSNVHVLFLLFSLVFTFFYLKSKKYFTDLPTFNYSLPVLLLTFVFVFSNNIFNINGARFWTASWIGVYCLFQLFINKNKKYWILVILLPLVHTGFTIFLFFSAISYFIRFNHNIILSIYIISFFFSEIVLNNIDLLPLDRLPTIIQNMVLYYTGEERLAEENEHTYYYILLNNLPLFYSKLLLLLLALKSRFFDSSISQKMVLFLLVFVTCVNISSGIPSIPRFYYCVMPLIVYLWLREYRVMSRYHLVIMLVPFVFAYVVFYWIKNVISISDSVLYTSFLPNIVIQNL